MGFEYRDHTADLAVRAWGGSLAEAFSEAARALLGAMVNLDRVAPVRRREFSLRSASLELLLVDWLSALVGEKDTSGLVFSRFDMAVTCDRQASLRVAAWGEPLDPMRHEARLEVKGISLLGLCVRAEGATWIAEYVADV